MPAYAFVTPDGTFEREVSFPNALNVEHVRRHPGGIPVVVPLSDAPPTQYDKNTHRLSEPRYTMRGGAMVRHYEVERLSDDEIAERVERSARLTPVQDALFRSLADRIRKLEGKAPLTDDQFRAWVLDTIRRTP